MISRIAVFVGKTSTADSCEITCILHPHSLVDMSIYLSELLNRAMPAYRRQCSILGKLMNRFNGIQRPQHIQLEHDKLCGIMQLVNAPTLELDASDENRALHIEEVSHLLAQLNQRMGVKAHTASTSFAHDERRLSVRFAELLAHTTRLLQSLRTRVA